MEINKTVRNIIAKKHKSSFLVNAEAEFATLVKPSFLHDLLEKKFLETLKKEWKLSEIDTKDLDWDWKDIKVKWGVTFPRSSGVLNIQIYCPDQKVTLDGVVDYTDEKNNDLSYDFSTTLDLRDVKTSLDSVKLNDDIAPSELEAYRGKFVLSF